LAVTQRAALGLDLKVNNSFDEPEARLMYVDHLMVYHQITAIETHSKDYDSHNELFMDDLARLQIGLR
jgi:hypothetical protein